MQKFGLLMVIVLVGAIGCTQPFKKSDKGIEYKIISDGKGQKLQYGDFMQFHVANYYTSQKGDTLLTDSRKMSPFMDKFDSITTPPEYRMIFSQLRKGDSLVIRLLTDSIFSNRLEQMPPFMRKGNYVITTIKMVNIFTTKEQADSVQKEAMAAAQLLEEEKSKGQMMSDDSTLIEFFKKNNITATKGEKGTYVQIIDTGKGPHIDSNVVVKTNYTGKTMDGNVFDSNTDSTFHHVAPINVNMTSVENLGMTVIKGWTDGMKLLRKGDSARFYIPSPLAYGPRGKGQKIPPNSILVFEIKVLDLIPKEKVAAELAAQAQKNEKMMREQHVKDSIIRAKKATPQPK